MMKIVVKLQARAFEGSTTVVWNGIAGREYEMSAVS